MLIGYSFCFVITALPYSSDSVSMFTVVTREDEVVFSSFVNCVVLTIIYAQEIIDKEESRKIPLTSVFGSEYNWALRDAISYSGSYNENFTLNILVKYQSGTGVGIH